MDLITRRRFLKAGGAAALGLSLGPTLLLRPALAAADPGARRKVVVVLFQRGGCDGLSAVVPYAEKAYYDLRRATAIAPPGKPNGCVKLAGRFGLHPALAPLAEDFAAKRLAFVHAIGSHDATRSHFDAQDYMETGTPGRKGTPDGWINRYQRATARDGDSTFRAVALTPTLPRAMKGDAKALAIASFEQFTFAGDRRRGGASRLGDAFDRMYRSRDDDDLHRSGTEAFDAVKRLRRINPRKFAPRTARITRGGSARACSPSRSSSSRTSASSWPSRTAGDGTPTSTRGTRTAPWRTGSARSERPSTPSRGTWATACATSS
jgi:hypothetical protein